MKLKFLTASIGLCSALVANSANSSVLTYQFSGFITNVDNAASPYFLTSIVSGNPWAASISIDDSSPDQFSGTLAGVYQGLDFSVAVGSALSYSNSDFLNLGIDDTSVSYNNANGSADNIRFNILTGPLWGVSSGLNVDGFRVTTTNIELATPDSPLFSEILSSVQNFQLSDFSVEKRFVIGFQNINFPNKQMTITGNINSLSVISDASPVPVPSAFWLFGSALIGLFGFKRNAHPYPV